MGGTKSSLQENPEPGDLIEISRGLYTHWMLYVGGGNVIHLTVPDGTSGVFYSFIPSVHGQKGLVKKQPLSEVVGDGTYRVSKKYDKKYNRRPREDILRDAEAMVDKLVRYDLFSNNCEHFATELRYGVPDSEQVVTPCNVSSMNILVIAGAALAFFGTQQRTQQRR